MGNKLHSWDFATDTCRHCGMTLEQFSDTHKGCESGFDHVSYRAQFMRETDINDHSQDALQSFVTHMHKRPRPEPVRFFDRNPFVQYDETPPRVDYPNIEARLRNRYMHELPPNAYKDPQQLSAMEIAAKRERAIQKMYDHAFNYSMSTRNLKLLPEGEYEFFVDIETDAEASKPKKGKSAMKSRNELANIAAMVAQDIVSVKCAYTTTAGDNALYTFKATKKFAATLQEGDPVLCSANTENTPYKVVYVREIDNICNLENPDEIRHRWIFQKVGTHIVDNLEKLENEIVDKLDAGQRSAMRDSVIDALNLPTEVRNDMRHLSYTAQPAETPPPYVPDVVEDAVFDDAEPAENAVKPSGDPLDF